MIPLTEYPDPFQAAEETTTLAFVADKVPVKDELPPTATFPKLRDDGDTASVPVVLLGVWACGPEDTPAQPVSADMPASAKAAIVRRNCDLNDLLMERLSLQN